MRRSVGRCEGQIERHANRWNGSRYALLWPVSGQKFLRTLQVVRPSPIVDKSRECLVHLGKHWEATGFRQLSTCPSLSKTTHQTLKKPPLDGHLGVFYPSTIFGPRTVAVVDWRPSTGRRGFSTTGRISTASQAIRYFSLVVE